MELSRVHQLKRWLPTLSLVIMSPVDSADPSTKGRRGAVRPKYLYASLGPAGPPANIRE